MKCCNKEVRHRGVYLGRCNTLYTGWFSQLVHRIITGHNPRTEIKKSIKLKFKFSVIVEATNFENAKQVVAERLDYDEEYGFDYSILWSAEPPNEPEDDWVEP